MTTERGFRGVVEPDPTRVYWWDGEYVEVIRGATRDYYVSASRPLLRGSPHRADEYFRELGPKGNP